MMRFTALFFLVLAGHYHSAHSEEMRALPVGQAPDDSRLQEPLTLHGYHPFRPVDSAEAWEGRKIEIKDRVLLASGLLPLPEKTPLHSRRFGRMEADGFAVEKVYFESFPGHFVTGNFFSPIGDSLKVGEKDGKRPAVLCPHGHWKNGRFYDVLTSGEAAVKNLIAKGDERFFSSARNPIQARCVQLARMGCYVFQYDMLGNADSIQFADHRRGPRESMNSSDLGKWGFVSPQAVLRLQSNFGLQTWNSLRAVDFVLEIPDVDPDRLMVTGASGGGTQTMVLAAIDDRIDAAFPCVMPSTAMQGGCTCENAFYLRIGQGNMDIAAAIAPKPMGMTAADDWTIELETKGHPDILNLYKMVGSPKNYEAHFNIQFKHNYNHVSRTQMYNFANTHLKLGLPTPVLEQDHKFLEPDQLRVWSEESDKPDHWKDGDTHERELNQVWASDTARRVENALSMQQPNSEEFQQTIAQGWRLILRRQMAELSPVEFDLVDKKKSNLFAVMSGLLLSSGDAQEEVPALFYYPENWNGEVIIWLSKDGKSGLYEGDPSTPSDPIRELVDQGSAVMGVDLFLQGEFLAGESTKNPQSAQITYSGKKDLPSDSWQRSPVYYYGYNDPTFVRRVHDTLSAIKMVKTHPDWDVKKIRLMGRDHSAHWAIAAGAMAGDSLEEVVVEKSEFRFEKVADFWHDDFVPGAVKYGDLDGLRQMNQHLTELP